jgi:putative acetyltransferase
LAESKAGSTDRVSIKVREMLNDDARTFLEVHHAAVRGTAAQDYPPQVVADWAPIPVTNKNVERFLAHLDGEIRLVAEIDGTIVGIAALVLADCELRGCYVAPEAARKGVGSALVREIERIARDHGLAYLQMDSSVTAEPFYSVCASTASTNCGRGGEWPASRWKRPWTDLA